MFNLFKKTSPTHTAPDLSALGTDMHSHLLPGIDDGAATLDDSLALIRGLRALGFRRLYTTPHVFREYYPNTSDGIRQALDTVRTAVAAEGIDVELHAAAEYYLDEHFTALLAQNDLLTLPGRHVLIEMSFFAPWPTLHQTIFDLRMKGYTPILAHPERYPYYAGKWETMEQLRDFGCLFQCNLPAFAGAYGKPPREFAGKLLDRGWVDFLGTDLHNARHLEAIGKAVASGAFDKLLNHHEFTNHTWLSDGVDPV